MQGKRWSDEYNREKKNCRPGTCLHAVRTLSNPRWEDWEYTPLDGEDVTGGNPLYWLGDGMSANEKSMTGDRAWYLDGIDMPPGTFLLSLLHIAETDSEMHPVPE